MKTLIIDGVEKKFKLGAGYTTDISEVPEGSLYYNGQWYEPIIEFKKGDWVTDDNAKNLYKYSHADPNGNHFPMAYGKYKTTGNPVSNNSSFGTILRKATPEEIIKHLMDIANENKLFDGSKLETLYSLGVFTLHESDSASHIYEIDNDVLRIRGYIVYDSGRWVKKLESKPLFRTEDGIDIYENDEVWWVAVLEENDSKDCCNSYLEFGKFMWMGPRVENKNYKWFSTRIKAQEYVTSLNPFEFGGNIINFKLHPAAPFDENKCTGVTGIPTVPFVEITCKEITGTHLELKNILKEYFTPQPFGIVKVVSFTWHNPKKYDNDIKAGFLYEDVNNVDKITIGCVTGTYCELLNAYNYCLTLLK